MPSRRVLIGLAIAWVVLLVPSIPTFGHECHGFVGFLAHSPMYAFFALSALWLLLAMVALGRRLAAPRGA